MQREHADRQQRQEACAPAHEQQRERDGDGDRGDHPRGEVDDESAQLRPGATAVGRAECPACHVLSCEQCEQPLGNASSPADLDGVSAEVILALWPEMNNRVKQHECYCPGLHNH